MGHTAPGAPMGRLIVHLSRHGGPRRRWHRSSWRSGHAWRRSSSGTPRQPRGPEPTETASSLGRLSVSSVFRPVSGDGCRVSASLDRPADAVAGQQAISRGPRDELAHRDPDRGALAPHRARNAVHTRRTVRTIDTCRGNAIVTVPEWLSEDFTLEFFGQEGGPEYWTQYSVCTARRSARR